MLKAYNDNLRKQILESALTLEFQTARSIASQCVFAPDRIARAVHDKSGTTAAEKSSVVSYYLHRLVKSGLVEKKRLSGNMNAYRLVKKAD